jgi:hypothetical protein
LPCDRELPHYRFQQFSANQESVHLGSSESLENSRLIMIGLLNFDPKNPRYNLLDQSVDNLPNS